MHAKRLNVMTVAFYEKKMVLKFLSSFHSLSLILKATISGPGIFCGPIRGSFAVRASFADQYGIRLRACAVICFSVNLLDFFLVFSAESNKLPNLELKKSVD